MVLSNLHTPLSALCVLPYQTSPLICLNGPEKIGEQILCILARHGATTANYYQQYRTSCQEDEQLAFKDLTTDTSEEQLNDIAK